MGLKPLQKALQIESIDQDLRNALWTAIDIAVWSEFDRGHASAVRQVLKTVWLLFFKHPLDRNPAPDICIHHIRSYLFECRWNEVYDLVEFLLEHGKTFTGALLRECNSALERENAGYRIVGTEITPITNPIEMEAVESAYQSGFAGVDIHIKRAVELLSDRKAPDYRNAIKEAVSAVESACRIVSNNEKSTLGEALKRISEKHPIHPAMEKGMSALYGFTNDAGGIRHSLLAESTVSFTDAKFMVIACSAFVNYLAGKMSDLGSKS